MHFDEAFDEVERGEVQTVFKNGDERAVMVQVDAWRTENPPAQSLLEFFQSSGLGDYDLDITRAKDLGSSRRLTF